MGGIKRDRHSCSEEAISNKNPKKKVMGENQQEVEDPDSLEEFINDPDTEPSPPSKSSRRLPSATESAREMRRMTAADMVALIINRAKKK